MSKSSEDRSDLARPLILVFLVALVVRGLYYLEQTSTAGFAVPLLDQKYYYQFAEAIAAGADLKVFGGFRPVLYPAFLACFVWLFGALGAAAAIAAQHAIGGFTSAAVGYLGYLLSGRQPAAAWAAGLLYALAGPVIFLEGELLIESSMPFLVVATLLEIAHASEAPKLRCAALWWAGAGALTSLTAQARPNMLLFVPAFGLAGVALACASRTRRPLVMLWALPAFLVVQVAFGFVNEWQSGKFQLVTSAGGINLYVGNNRRADGMIPRVAYSTSYEGEYRDSIAVFSEVEYRRLMAEEGREPSTDPNVISNFWTQRTVDEIKAEPGRWVVLMAKKVALTFANYEIPNGESFAFAWREDSTLLKLLPVRWFLLMFLLPVGLLAAWRRGNRTLLLMLVLFLVFYAASFILFFVNGRFRIPLWPAATTIAGVGAAYLWRQFRDGASCLPRRALGAGIVLVVVSLLGKGLVGEEDFSGPYFFRSLAWYERGDPAKARDDMEKSLRTAPATGDYLMHFGNVEFALGNYEAAIAQYRKALEADPDEPRTHNNIGAALEELGRFAEAYATYQKALSLVPRHRTALVNCALLELRAGDIERARAHLDLAAQVEATGDDAALLTAQGLLASADGDTESARKLLDRANALAPRQTQKLAEQSRQKIQLAGS